jgi:hypothetical protein
MGHPPGPVMRPAGAALVDRVLALADVRLLHLLAGAVEIPDDMTETGRVAGRERCGT